MFSVLIGLLPSLQNLAANVAHTSQLRDRACRDRDAAADHQHPGQAAADIDGKTIAPGQIVYPGFDADVLWKFRWYSIINQLLIWTLIGLVFGTLLDAARPRARCVPPPRPSPAVSLSEQIVNPPAEARMAPAPQTIHGDLTTRVHVRHPQPPARRGVRPAVVKGRSADTCTLASPIAIPSELSPVADRGSHSRGAGCLPGQCAPGFPAALCDRDRVRARAG